MASRSSTFPAHAQAQWLFTTEVAFERMLTLIAEAKTSIRCETYIWRDDEIGGRFRAALAQAACRGVRVRILVDGVGSGALPTGYWEAVIQAGGHVRVFNPFSLSH